MLAALPRGTALVTRVRSRTRHVPSLRRAAGLALVSLGLAGCGAKTGLGVPDASRDATTDAPPPEPPPPLCIEVPPGDPIVRVELSVPARLQVVDVVFLVDSSASMEDEIGAVRRGLRERVVPGIRALIPDAAFGVALFGEFPVEPHAFPDSDVGPYRLRTPVTTDVARVETALEDTPRWANLDDPEAAIEGLFQVATGEGLAPWIEPTFGCPSGGVGGACFRDEAFRIVMLVTDAPMHEGPPGVPPFAPYEFTPSPHGYADALDAVAALDLFVIGLGATDTGRPNALPHLAALGRDTGSVDGAGAPLTFDIGGRGDRIGEEIVAAVRRVADDVPLEVDAIVEDTPGDELDLRELVIAVRPASASPPSGASIDGARFVAVEPGTRLTFELEIDASAVPPSPTRREVPGRVIFRESGRSRIDAQDVLVVLPGDDGDGCDDL